MHWKAPIEMALSLPWIKVHWTMTTTKSCVLLEDTVAPSLQHVTKIHYKRPGKDKPQKKNVSAQN